MPPLQLVENPDILATISKLKDKRPPLVIGFAAETEHLIDNAKAKIARKGCDWILANDVSPASGVMGGDRNTVHLLTRNGSETAVDSWPVMAGDASIRSYARLEQGGNVFILMNSPKRPDGPAIYDGKSYSAAVHLAEDVKPFVAIAGGLRDHGFSAPEIRYSDLESGFLITEDFGSAPVVEGNPPAPILERYEAATDMMRSASSRKAFPTSCRAIPRQRCARSGRSTLRR